MHHPLEQRIVDIIKAHAGELVATSGRMVVALSGGADSVALLALLSSLGYKCVALHCNFHLRGAESDRDESHARCIAESLNADFEVLHCDVAQWQKQHGGSVEMACRDLRYQWFFRRIIDLDCRAIAVAHNLTDNIETFFINLLRASSLAGLTGMDVWNPSTRVLRPLLTTSRAELEEYLEFRNLEFIVDSTNLENNFLRNRIRNIIIPALSECTPIAVNAMSSTISHLSHNFRYYLKMAEISLRRAETRDGGVDLVELYEREGDDAAQVLYTRLFKMGFNYSQTEDIIAARNRSGAHFASRECELIIDRGVLREPVVCDVIGGVSLEADVVPVSEVDFSKCPGEAYFSPCLAEDVDRIVIRAWRHGDRMKPWGVSGTKKLSDIFNDSKIAVDRKSAIPIVALDGDILWIPGIRTSRLYPLVKSDSQALRLRIKSRSPI